MSCPRPPTHADKGAPLRGAESKAEIELKEWLDDTGRGYFYPSMKRVEEILEFLDTKAMLNKKGKTFRHMIWEKYVKGRGS